jgi:hypothetical protein
MDANGSVDAVKPTIFVYVTPDLLDRIEALVNVGVDVVSIDTAHDDSLVVVVWRIFGRVKSEMVESISVLNVDLYLDHIQVLTFHL